MVSLWGSKNGEERPDGEETNGEHSRQESRHSTGRDPDERTRLLPPRNDGFLDPDDPAVSPSQRDPSLHLLMIVQTGITLQSLECQSPPLPLRSIPRHQLSMVGPPLSVHLRQPSDDAFPWLWLLRLLIHHTHHRKSPRRNSLFLHTVQTNGVRQLDRGGLLID